MSPEVEIYTHLQHRGKLLSDYWDCVTINIHCKVKISQKLWHQNVRTLDPALFTCFAALYSYFTALPFSSSQKQNIYKKLGKTHFDKLQTF